MCQSLFEVEATNGQGVAVVRRLGSDRAMSASTPVTLSPEDIPGAVLTEPCTKYTAAPLRLWLTYWSILTYQLVAASNDDGTFTPLQSSHQRKAADIFWT